PRSPRRGPQTKEATRPARAVKLPASTTDTRPAQGPIQLPVKKDQQRLDSIDEFYVLLIDQAADPTSPWHHQASALKEKLEARGKRPSKPDLKAWYGLKGS